MRPSLSLITKKQSVTGVFEEQMSKINDEKQLDNARVTLDLLLNTLDDAFDNSIVLFESSADSQLDSEDYTQLSGLATVLFNCYIKIGAYLLRCKELRFPGGGVDLLTLCHAELDYLENISNHCNKIITALNNNPVDKDSLLSLQSHFKNIIDQEPEEAPATPEIETLSPLSDSDSDEEKPTPRSSPKTDLFAPAPSATRDPNLITNPIDGDLIRPNTCRW